MADQTTEHPVPVQSFLKTLVGSHDEVFSRLIAVEHRWQNKTMTEWRAALQKLRGLPEDPAPPAAPVETPVSEAPNEEHV